MKNLTDFKIGESAVVNDVFSEGLLKERMLALGLTKGTEVEVLRKGPRNNLTVFNIRGVMIALRREEASLIIASNS